MRPGWRRARVFALAAALVVAAAACQADATVDLTLAEDGSGEVAVTVTLDADAAARVPDLADDLRVADLEATGWTVTGPDPTEDGGVTIEARKPFATPEQGRAVLREVGGRGGILRAIELRRDHTFGETTWTFGAGLDLSAGLGGFSDEDLDAVLGADAFGLDQAALEEELGEPLPDTMSVTVEAHLPDGEFTTNGDATGATSARWSADLGDEPVRMAAESSERDTTVWILVGVAAGALVLLVLLLVFRLIRGAYRRRRQRREADPAT